MPVLTIDAKDWFRGMSTSDELADGGFSPLSKGINLYASPGLLLPGKAPSNGTGDMQSGGVFAWSTISTSIAPGAGRALGNNGSSHGKFYFISSLGAATLGVSDTARVYTANVSDLIRYGNTNQQYSTSNQNVGLSNFDWSVNDFTWWTVTQGKTAMSGGVPHHFVQYGNTLYWTDGNLLHSWDGTTATYNCLDLPAGYVMTDITVYNNLIFISAAQFDPIGGGDSINNRLFTWDGFSDSFIDEYPLQERIDALIPFGGSLLVTTRRYVGYFTGSTLSPLYALTTPVYKYQVAITYDRLYLLQGMDLLCYGNPVISKPKFFSYPLRNTVTMTGINSFVSGVIMYAGDTMSGSFSNVNGSDQTSSVFYGNKIPFGRLVNIRMIAVESEALASGSSITIDYLDDRAAGKTLDAYSFTNFGATTKRDYDIFKKLPTFTYQQKVTFSATPNKGIRRIHVFYEATEVRSNK